MADIDVTSKEGKCVLCDDPTDFSAKVPLQLPPLTGTGEPISPIRLPPIWLCPVDRRRFAANHGIVGWCESCFAWGEEFAVSSCGQPYMPRM